MKTYIFKGIISAVVSSILFVILSVAVGILIDKGYFVYDNLKLFRPNVVGVTIIVISSLIPLVLCRFKKFTELLVYSIFFHVSINVLYTLIFGGTYALFYTFDHYGFEMPFVIPNVVFDATYYNLVYMSIGIVAGFICSIAVNVTRNISAKKNVKVDDNL